MIEHILLRREVKGTRIIGLMLITNPDASAYSVDRVEPDDQRCEVVSANEYLECKYSTMLEG